MAKLTMVRVQIFSTGKSLNFMKYSCDDAAWVMERSHADQPGASAYSTLLSAH